MGLFHKECYKSDQYAHISECESSIAFPSVLRSRLDRCSEGEREFRERKKAPRLRWTFLCGGQVADCWSWEMKAGEDHWSTVQYIASGDGSHPSLLFSVFSPSCLWASDASGSGVVECWEDQSGLRPLTVMRRSEKNLKKRGSDEKRQKNTRIEHSTKNRTVSSTHLFLAHLFLGWKWCRGMWTANSY